jgi:mono/diheme cytochrome c family protein
MKTNFLQFPLVLLFIAALLCLNFPVSAQNEKVKDWNVPAEYKAMKNPVKNNDKNIAYGQEQYIKYCAACHGKTGKGDGEKAKTFVNISVANLALDKFASQSDGEHFYKIKIGRDNLHSFKGKVDDETIWSIIHYVKTFKN